MGTYLVATGMEDHDPRIEALDLTVQTYNCLKRSGIHTVGQLFSLQKQELLSLRNMTPRLVEEIRDRLIACGFLDPAHLLGPFTEDDDQKRS